MTETAFPPLRLPQPATEAQRLFHGRGKHHPGHEHLVIDWLPPVIVIGLYRPVARYRLTTLARWLHQQIDGCEAVLLQHRFEPAGPVSALLGHAPEKPFAIDENGLRYLVHPGRNRNSGLFLDMRNGRDWVRRHATGKRVLNLFAYTCGFSVAALAGGASAVVNVDMSGRALAIGRDNHRLNELPLTAVRFEKLDIFRSFGRLRRRGPFDLLVCDPPTRQKGSVDVERDYPRILRRLDEFMAPGGELLLCLNAPRLGRDFLLDAVAALAPQYRFVADIPPPAVFADAEGRGLKVLHFRNQTPGTHRVDSTARGDLPPRRPVAR